MRKTNLIKIFSVIIIGMMLMFYSTEVFADNDTFTDLTSTINSTQSNGTNSNSSNSSSNTTNNSSSNSSRTNTSNNTTNNSSVYTNNSTNLPSTGIEDSFPVGVLIVVLIISSVYAYKKINEYKNI